MGYEREFLVLSVKNRRLCNIATTYYLLKKAKAKSAMAS
jgi:hypothetical protein